MDLNVPFIFIYFYLFYFLFRPAFAKKWSPAATHRLGILQAKFLEAGKSGRRPDAHP